MIGPDALSSTEVIDALGEARRVGPFAITTLRLGRGHLGVSVSAETPRLMSISDRVLDEVRRGQIARRIAGVHALSWSRKLPVHFLGESGERLWCAQAWVPSVPVGVLLNRAEAAGGAMPHELASGLYWDVVRAGQPTAAQRAVRTPAPGTPVLNDYVVTRSGRVLHVDPARDGSRREAAELGARLTAISEPFDTETLGRRTRDPRALGRFVESLAGDLFAAQEAAAEEVAMLAGALPRGAAGPVTRITRGVPTRRAWRMEDALRTGALDSNLEDLVQVAHAEVSRLGRVADAETLVLDSAWDDETVSVVTHALQQKARRVARDEQSER